MPRSVIEGAGGDGGFSLDAALEMKNAEEGGQADGEPRETDFHPYVKVRVSTNNAVKKTRALDHSDMNPEWNESLVFDIPGRMKLKRDNSVSQSLLNLSGLGSNRKKNVPHGLGLISTLKAVNHGPEEIEFSFEAWHKDAKISLDDKIGSANLGLPLSKFSGADHWTSRESVRLYDDRGIASGLLYILVKWKSLSVVFTYMTIGIVVYLLLEGPNSTFASTPLTPEVVVNGTVVESAVYPEVKFVTSVDAVYFAVCTFTTVGYGDVVPQTQAGRLFTVVYALLGVAIVAVGINIMVFACLESGRELVEYCSRVYMIPGMMEDGKPGLPFVDSLYMCTMTASSIGYGDLHPRNQAGRTFLIFWMISGYVVMASSIREISQLYLKLKERHAEQRILNREVGQEVLGLDEDGDGEVDRYEYLAHMVVAMGKMHKHEVIEIMTRFDELDRTGDGRLSRADFDPANNTPTGDGETMNL
eukprot:g3814.t1